MSKIDTSKFKDGDILYASSENGTVYTVFIYKKDTPYLTGCYASYYWCRYGYGEMEFHHDYSMDDDSVHYIRYANMKEKKRFFKNLDNYDYKWDKKNKKLVRIIFRNLKPFDKVLVRKDAYGVWECDFYSHIEYINGFKFHKTINTGLVKECVPFNDETIYLLCTADKPSKKYDIFK